MRSSRRLRAEVHFRTTFLLEACRANRQPKVALHIASGKNDPLNCSSFYSFANNLRNFCMDAA